MSIDFDLRLWDTEKADKRWLAWFDLSPEDRAHSEPEEEVESVLEIMEQNDAPEEWVLGRLAALDLAFGQVGETLAIKDLHALEPFAKFFLISFAGYVVEGERSSSLRLFLHPMYYTVLLEVVTEQAIRDLVQPHLFEGERLVGMRRLFAPIDLPEDPSFATRLADALVDFWKSLEPFFKQAVLLDGGRGNIVIIDTVNGETDSRLLLDRAAEHVVWLREEM